MTTAAVATAMMSAATLSHLIGLQGYGLYSHGVDSSSSRILGARQAQAALSIIQMAQQVMIRMVASVLVLPLLLLLLSLVVVAVVLVVVAL